MLHPNLCGMRLYIARHGETVENKRKIIQGTLPGQLTERGKQQARALAERLAEEDIASVFSSDLQRCVDTLHPFIDKTRVTPVYDPALRERSYGVFEGQNAARFEEHMRAVNRGKDPFSTYPPNGESFYVMQKRVIDWFSSASFDGNVLLMTHKGPKIALLMYLLGKGTKDYDSLKSDNTALSIFEKTGKIYVPITINSTDHLQSQ